MQTNERPTYGVKPHYSTTRKLVVGTFDIYQYVNYQEEFLFTMSNKGDRLHNLTCRGIPLEDARKLFYEMD